MKWATLSCLVRGVVMTQMGLEREMQGALVEVEMGVWVLFYRHLYNLK